MSSAITEEHQHEWPKHVMVIRYSEISCCRFVYHKFHMSHAPKTEAPTCGPTLGRNVSNENTWGRAGKIDHSASIKQQLLSFFFLSFTPPKNKRFGTISIFLFAPLQPSPPPQMYWTSICPHPPANLPKLRLWAQVFRLDNSHFSMGTTCLVHHPRI